MHSRQLKVVIIMGPPGSGKGSQAQLLAEKLNLYYLETSKILEEKIMDAKSGEYVIVKGQKYSLLREKKDWLNGKLLSPPLVAFWLIQKIKQLAKDGQSLILAGSPRTVPEAEEVIPLLKKLYSQRNIKIVFLDISARETVLRNSRRRICVLMRHSILFSKENEKLTKCPLDGSKLVPRKGLDDPETIKIRLKQYRERTFPLLWYFRRQGLKVVKINGSPAPAVVYKNVLRALKRGNGFN